MTQSPMNLSSVPSCLDHLSATTPRYRLTVSRVSRACSSKQASALRPVRLLLPDELGTRSWLVSVAR